MPRASRRFLLPLLMSLVLFFGLLTACDAKTSEDNHDLAMASLDGMPLDLKNAPVAVQQAYQFNWTFQFATEDLP